MRSWLIDSQPIIQAQRAEVSWYAVVAGSTKYSLYDNYNVDRVDKRLEYAIFCE